MSRKLTASDTFDLVPFKRRRNNHAKRFLDRENGSNELLSRQVTSLRASVESIRADLLAEVAQRTADLADAEARRVEAGGEFDRRLSRDDLRHGNELKALTADLDERIGGLRTSLAGETAWSNGNFSHLSKRIDEQAGAQASANEAQAAALSALQIGLSSAVHDVTAALHAAQSRQTAAIQSLRDSITADNDAQAELNDALHSGLVEIKALHSLALEHAAQALETRIAALAVTHSEAIETSVSSLESRIASSTEAQSRTLQATTAAVHAQIAALVHAHESHVVSLEAMESAQSSAAAMLVEQHKTVVDRLISSDAMIGRVTSRLTAAEGRVDDALSAASRVDGLAQLLDEIRDRLAAAEGLLQQRDMTDLELQLDRMESFERLAAETNPDQFAAKAEVEALRARLSEIELSARQTPAT